MPPLCETTMGDQRGRRDAKGHSDKRLPSSSTSGESDEDDRPKSPRQIKKEPGGAKPFTKAPRNIPRPQNKNEEKPQKNQDQRQEDPALSTAQPPPHRNPTAPTGTWTKTATCPYPLNPFFTSEMADIPSFDIYTLFNDSVSPPGTDPPTEPQYLEDLEHLATCRVAGAHRPAVVHAGKVLRANSRYYAGVTKSGYQGSGPPVAARVRTLKRSLERILNSAGRAALVEVCSILGDDGMGFEDLGCGLLKEEAEGDTQAQPSRARASASSSSSSSSFSSFDNEVASGYRSRRDRAPPLPPAASSSSSSSSSRLRGAFCQTIKHIERREVEFPGPRPP